MKLTGEQRISLERSTARYERDVDRAATYLVGRGLTEETAHSFRLGVVNDDPLPGDEAFAGRLSIPYLTPAGVVAVRYRCLERHSCHDVGCPKYLGAAGTVSRLFNVGSLHRPGDHMLVTEGELDAIVLHQIGLPSVGVPGAANWKPHYSRIFEDYRVRVFADGDDAGREFGRRVAEAVAGALVVMMPSHLDVNETYLDARFGEEWLRSKAEG